MQKTLLKIIGSWYTEYLIGVKTLTLILRWPLTHFVTLNQYLKLSRSSVLISKMKVQDFPGGTVVKNLSANAGDTGLIPGPGRSHMPRSN